MQMCSAQVKRLCQFCFSSLFCFLGQAGREAKAQGLEVTRGQSAWSRVVVGGSAVIRELCRQILCHCVNPGKELVFYATGSGEISHGNVLSKEVT